MGHSISRSLAFLPSVPPERTLSFSEFDRGHTFVSFIDTTLACIVSIDEGTLVDDSVTKRA
ncbi:hypothetical protein WN48_00489 [Eufriesea mexicana]|nr:hypothetical protein WN48_00489 [Eufriesea mexicana]